MKLPTLLSSALIGAVASARSMTPMATLAVARLAGRHVPGRLILLDRPLVRCGTLAMGVGELLGDKMKSAPDRTVFLGLLARVLSAGIAGAALAPQGRQRAGAAVAVATAVPLAYLTLAGRKRATVAGRSDPQRAGGGRAGGGRSDGDRGPGDAAQGRLTGATGRPQLRAAP